MRRLPVWVFFTIAVVSGLRAYIGAHFPITEDEAYYWSWSRHLAYGYLDHPPAVAWFIFAGSFLGHSSLAVRFPFILAEAVAAFFAGAAAIEAVEDPRAGAVAAMFVTFIPELRFAIGEALPDGPYVMFWAFTLYMALRAVKTQNLVDVAMLGVALGGALLSRALAWGLVFGIVFYTCLPAHRAVWRRGGGVAFIVAGLLYAPFVVWNATHRWVNASFTLYTRLEPHVLAFTDFARVSTPRAVVLAIVGITCYYSIRMRRGGDLIAWTALPLTVFLTLLSAFTTTESYWLLGPLTSLCVGFGIASIDISRIWKRVFASLWGVAGAYTFATALFLALPEHAEATVLQASHGALAGPVYSGVFSYAQLSQTVRSLSNHGSVMTITDSYEIASELLWNGVDSTVVGTTQAWQWQTWHPRIVPSHALVITYSPLSRDAALFHRLRRVFGKITSSRSLHFSFAQMPAHTFYVAWAETPLIGSKQQLYDDP